MSDLGEFGSSLPSYPSLPSPPKSDQLFLEDLCNPTSFEDSNGSGVKTSSSAGYFSPEQPVLATQQNELKHTLSPLSSDDTNSLGGGDTPITSTPIYATVKKPAVSQYPPPATQFSESPLLQADAQQRTTSGSPLTPDVSPLPSTTHPSPAAGSSDSMALRIKYLEQLCGKLVREKNEMEEDFGRQRKSFMNQMAHSDAQLSLCRQKIDKSDGEIRELSKELLSKDEQLQNLSVAVRITEASVREKYDADRVKYEEEIASLRKIVSVQSQDTSQVMQHEREMWKQEKATLRAEIDQLRQAAAAATSPYPKAGRTSPLEKLGKSPTPDSEDADLELSMLKAAEDTKLLRSVVLPLEEEIQLLKAKLSETEAKLNGAESKLAELEALKDSTVLDAALIDLSTPVTEQNMSLEFSHDLTSPIPTDTKELQHQLKLVRTACNDLEMHTSQLNMQKNIMQEEIRSLSEQLTKVSTELEVERTNCKELRKTWELANDHFIVNQDRLKQEVYRLQQKLERGDAPSPMREITVEELPVPTIIERTQGDGKEKGKLTVVRTHKRSWSTDEASDVCLEIPTNLQQTKSASWTSLHQSPERSLGDSISLLDRARMLEEELAKVRGELKRKHEICTNYEKQLARVQEQLMKDLNAKELAIDELKSENENLKAFVMRQRQEHELICRKMDDLKEEMKTRIENFVSNEKELQNSLRLLKDKFKEIKQDTQREIAKMNEDRRVIYQQLERTREEYDCLKAIQNSCVTDYQAQLADMKQTLTEAESRHASTATHLSTTKDQLRQAREMLSAERAHKEKLVANLSSQLDAAKKEIEKLSPLAPKLEAEKSAKEEAIAAKTATERKSRDFITEQHEKIEQLMREKEKAETQVSELQTQVASLKHKLNHTEETQKDFVELSQSLQMKLADMEEKIEKSHELQESFSTPST